MMFFEMIVALLIGFIFAFGIGEINHSLLKEHERTNQVYERNTQWLKNSSPGRR